MILKMLIILLLLSFNSFCGTAQKGEGSILAFGIGPTYLGSGDLLGMNYGLEVPVSLSNKFKLVPALAYYHAKFPDKFTTIVDESRGVTFDLQFRYIPFVDYGWFSVSTGPSVRVVNNHYEDFSESVNTRETAYGGLVSLRYRLMSTPKFSSGIQFTNQTYFNGDIAWTLAIFASFGR